MHKSIESRQNLENANPPKRYIHYFHDSVSLSSPENQTVSGSCSRATPSENAYCSLICLESTTL
jgi:hypothetical protein